MAKRRDFSSDDVFNAWCDSFSRAIDKKFYYQGMGIYVSRKRTSNTAMSVVGKLRKVPEETVRLSLTVYEDEHETTPELIRIYENELLQARRYPESFAEELYQFYTNTAKHIRENGKLDLVLSLVAFVEDRSFENKAIADFAVYSAFMDLLLQQMEFLKENALDHTKILAGITIDGSATLEIPDPLSSIDLPLYMLTMLRREYARVDAPSFLEQEYRKLGYPGIRSLDDYQLLNARSTIYIANVNCMAGFINEYTMDMLPKVPLAIGRSPMHAPRLKPSYSENRAAGDSVVQFGSLLPIGEYLSILVRHRRRMLPANGVNITFSGSSFYRVLTIKEIFKYGDMYLLYGELQLAIAIRLLFFLLCGFKI